MRLLGWAINKYIIKIHHKLSNEWLQNLIHQTHKCAWCIWQTKRHHSPFIKPKFSFESCLTCFPLITFPDPNLLMATFKINFRNFAPCNISNISSSLGIRYRYLSLSDLLLNYWCTFSRYHLSLELIVLELHTDSLIPLYIPFAHKKYLLQATFCYMDVLSRKVLLLYVPNTVFLLLWMQLIILISQIKVNSIAIVRMKFMDGYSPLDQSVNFSPAGGAFTSNMEQVCAYELSLQRQWVVCIKYDFLRTS